MLATMASAFIIFVKVKYVDQIHNYEYMKSYTMMLLPIMLLFFYAIEPVSMAWFRNTLSAIGACWICAVGIAYVHSYAQTSRTVDPVSCASRLRTAGVNSDDYVWMMRDNDIDTLAYGSALSLRLFNLEWYPDHRRFPGIDRSASSS